MSVLLPGGCSNLFAWSKELNINKIATKCMCDGKFGSWENKFKAGPEYHCEVFPLQMLSWLAKRNQETYLQFKCKFGHRGHFFQVDGDQICPLGYNAETTQDFASAVVYIKN